MEKEHKEENVILNSCAITEFKMQIFNSMAEYTKRSNDAENNTSEHAYYRGMADGLREAITKFNNLIS